MKWLGHILRMDQHRLVRRAALAQFKQGNNYGNLFMDVPVDMTLQQLIVTAGDRPAW